jgi:hypothetical protein
MGTTHEYKDTIHVVLQRMDLGLVVTLGFLLVKRPQRVGPIVKVPNHPSLVRLLCRGATINATPGHIVRLRSSIRC